MRIQQKTWNTEQKKFSKPSLSPEPHGNSMQTASEVYVKQKLASDAVAADIYMEESKDLFSDGKNSGSQPVQVHCEASDIFFIDTKGEQPKSPASVDFTPFSAMSSSILDSSEDEVVFSGRREARSPVGINVNEESVGPVMVKVVDDSEWVTTKTLTERSLDPGPTIRPNVNSKWEETLTLEKPRWPRRSRQKKSSRKDDTAILRDYIDNMDPQYAFDLSPSGEESQLIKGHQAERSTPQKSKGKNGITERSLEESSTDDDHDEDTSDTSDTSDSASLDDILTYFRNQPSSRGSKSKIKGRKAASPAISDDFLDLEGYGSFDIMDIEPSIRKKKKKGRNLDFDLSDSDLELHLKQSWEKDRGKKKARKKEREQLRAQGLLGRKQKPSSKSAISIGLDEVKTKLRSFLQSSAESLDLPPMRKNQRRLVHEMANALGLKSQSRGKGFTRYPVMYKTSRTPNFSGKHSVKLEKILSQPRFIPSVNHPAPTNYVDRREKKGKRPQHKGDVSYLDGDVVGASAPEIGVNNKGRAMLEKMGWSSGTALGAIDNKGILQPVTQVMKNSRAGLG
ncbi:hypothetical protein BGW36DRAFT_81741 [Talaromyces proteolyticus]|uniref:Protein SQS1 n=1 Tax=Talaromyces proteolyticus TaxID=1131652 RepID=A0AAD4KI25_9EURO|nr:uncharacterized protein BGW36DRAFT_81741 [Talaromyces proteolyticus]KAH8688897.1 hypothetical protein BGW36DRAFT_81741 [Talaromyces proteolyticus]